MRVPDRRNRWIGYRLNILGVRVWSDRCQLVTKDRTGNWVPFGRARPLPVFVPEDPDDIESDPLLQTALQYNVERPGSDLLAVLARETSFEDALERDGVPGAAG